MYYFYIIYSKNLDRYYYGHTEDLTERLKKHKSNHKGWTGNTNDWGYVYYETFDTKEIAYERERQVKSWKNRSRIEEMIKIYNAGSEHPDI